MAAALLLDLLIFLVPLMLIPLGLWRGGAHEGFVGGGILLGWAVANSWTGAWGGWLAALLNASPSAMEFLVACLVLAVGAGAGHAAGTIVGLPRPEADGRIAGAILAWLNGVLFLTLALGAYGASLGGEPLNPIITRGFLTEAVIVHERWVLLGVGLVVLGLIGTVFWVNAVVGQVYDPGYVPGQRTVFTSTPPVPERIERALRSDPRQPITEPYSNWPTAPRQRAITVPRAADAGKVEPVASRFRSALSRINPPTSGDPGRRVSLRDMFAQTMPVDVRDRTAEHESGGDRGRASRTGTTRPRPVTGRTPGDVPAAGDVPETDDVSPRPAPPSISEWIRVSGLSNPMMAPPPTKTTPTARGDANAAPDAADAGDRDRDASHDDVQPDGTPEQIDRPPEP